MSFGAMPEGERIDIGASVRAAYAVVLDNSRLAVELAWLPFAILVAAEVVALLLGGGGWFGHLLAGLVRGLGFLVFGSIFMVRWHRFMLLGERNAADLVAPGLTSFLLAAIKVGATIFVGTLVLGLIMAMPPHFLTAPLAFLGALALAFGSARVSLVFPAAAVERPMGLREAWDRLEGNY